MRSLLFSILISAGFVFVFNPEVSAAPAGGAAVGEAGQQSDALILVRDGCGRGRHFSRYRGICVWNSAPGYTGYRYRPYRYAYRPYRYGYPVFYPDYRPAYQGYDYGYSAYGNAYPAYGYGYYGYPAYGYPAYGYYRPYYRPYYRVWY